MGGDNDESDKIKYQDDNLTLNSINGCIKYKWSKYHNSDVEIS